MQYSLLKYTELYGTMFLNTLIIWHFIQVFVPNHGLPSESEGQSQSDEVSANKRLSGEKEDGKEYVCQVGVFLGQVYYY